MPLGAASAIPSAAYAVRAMIRGTAAPDLPADAIVFGALAAVLLLAAFAGSAAQERRDQLSGQMHEGDNAEGGQRHDDEV
jgi:hypothetical protein